MRTARLRLPRHQETLYDDGGLPLRLRPLPLLNFLVPGWLLSAAALISYPLLDMIKPLTNLSCWFWCFGNEQAHCMVWLGQDLSRGDIGGVRCL